MQDIGQVNANKSLVVALLRDFDASAKDLAATEEERAENAKQMTFIKNSILNLRLP